MRSTWGCQWWWEKIDSQSELYKGYSLEQIARVEEKIIVSRW